MKNNTETINAASALIRVKDEYRGQGVDVSHCGNDVQAILQTAGWDWKVYQTKMYGRGQTAYSEAPGCIGNWRSDNGAFLSACSEDYRPHHNAELARMMVQFANASGQTIVRAGMFGGGSRVWAVAESNVKGEVAKGDIVKMQTVMRSGHVPGVANITRARVIRLACLNGQTLAEGMGMVRFVHSSRLTESRVDRVAAYVDATGQGFRRYQEAMARLYTTPSNGFIDRLMLLELVQPELVQLVHDRLHRISNARPASSTPATVSLDAVIREAADREDSVRVVRNLIAVEGNRRAKLLDMVLDNQAGASYSRGTLAHAVNAVSAYTTHLQGRTPETGLESSLFETGGDMATEAMHTALQYAPLVQQVAGR